MRRCLLLNPGLVEYGKAWEMQKEIFHALSQGKTIDTLLFLQHPPTYTFGRRSQKRQPLLDDPPSPRPSPFGGEGQGEGKFSGENNIKGSYIYWVDRGGGATYHGPGQIIGYPILALRSYTSDYHAYLRMLEEVIIRTLADFGIKSQRINGYTGVWVKDEGFSDETLMSSSAGSVLTKGHENSLSRRERDIACIERSENRVRVGLFSDERKIASIGVRIVRGVTMHGFALNVNNDLEPFDMITPCNIKGVKMTSMSRILRTTLNIPVVEESLIRNFALIFGVCFEKKCNPPYRFK